MATTVTYDPVLARVRLSYDVPAGTTASVSLERSTDSVRWTTVRGADHKTASPSTTATADDYEFPPGVLITYRAHRYNAGGTLLGTATVGTITVDLDGVWLKSIGRPFLNRKLWVVDIGDVTRAARGGVFDVIGRTLPVAVTDQRGSRRLDLTVLVDTAAEAADFDAVMAAGDPVYLQTPPDCPIPAPSMYAVVGDVTATRPGRLSEVRTYTLPLTEIAAPDPDVVGATVTWQGVLNAYATWTAVTAAEPTWNDLLELIGSPSDVVIP